MNAPNRRPAKKKQEGFALLLAIIALTILAVLVADLHETTGTNFAAAMAERDQLKAEYLAKSGVNLTRMLIAQERALRIVVAPMYSMMLKGKQPPQLPVWQYANMILQPFADFENSKEDAASAGFDLDMSKGLGKTGGTFEILATAENGKINVNDPGLDDRAIARNNVAALLSSLIAGGPSPNKYDVLFSSLDERGRTSSRADLVANVVDWWDIDEQRSNFDPLMGTVDSSGGEDADYYRSQVPPYNIKNAPFDTLEELRLVRGMSDDVWATFVEPDVEDPRMRLLTIWGGSSINPNEADPTVILARVCSFNEFKTQALCADPTGLERVKFIKLITLARSFAQGVPFFSRASDFKNFLLGDEKSLFGDLKKLMASGMGAMLGLSGGGVAGAAGGGADLPFMPLKIPPAAPNAPPTDLDRRLQRTFTTTSRHFTLESTGRVGRSVKRIRTVINIDDKWLPPKPNAVTMPPLGIFSYYRID